MYVPENFVIWNSISNLMLFIHKENYEREIIGSQSNLNESLFYFFTTEECKQI